MDIAKYRSMHRFDRTRSLRATLVLAYAVGVGAVLFWSAEGYSYYRTPLRDRPRHEAHWALKPGGTTGHAFGVAGASMMTLMLLYSARKRIGALRRLGPLSVWLQGHIFLGIFGPALIVLHSALKFGGLVGISFWSMVAVVSSGVVGRFLYAQVPRSAAGDELTLAEAQDLERRLTEELRREFGLSERHLADLQRASTAPFERHRGLVAILLRSPLESLRLRRRVRRLRRDLPAVSRGAASRFATLARRRALLRRRLELWRQLRQLFHYWHVFHKPFAILMYTFMVVHIAVAWMTGYARLVH